MPFPCYSGWEPYSPIIPKLYYDVDSVEQRTKAMAYAIEAIEQYCDLVSKELNKHTGEITALQKEDVRLLNVIQAYVAEFQNNVDRIDAVLQGIGEGGEMIWNYVLSEYQDSKQAIRGMRNDINTVDGFTVEETSCYTVKQMADSGLTARGWALISRNVMKPHRPPKDMFVNGCNCK